MKNDTNRPNLSIVIPAYNEAARLPATLDTIVDYVKSLEQQIEIIIIDDGSNDGMSKAVEDNNITGFNIRILRNKKNRGKGASIRRGMAAAKGNMILFSDADLSTPIEEYEKLAVAIKQGADIAIASRDLPESRVSPPQPLYRELMGKTFNHLVQWIVLPGIRDTQCGFKLFRRDIARKIFARLSIQRFGFDVEALYIGKYLGANIREIPVNWHDVSGSKVSPVKDAIQMFLDLFRVRRRHRKLQ